MELGEVLNQSLSQLHILTSLAVFIKTISLNKFSIPYNFTIILEHHPHYVAIIISVRSQTHFVLIQVCLLSPNRNTPSQIYWVCVCVFISTYTVYVCIHISILAKEGKCKDKNRVILYLLKSCNSVYWVVQ